MLDKPPLINLHAEHTAAVRLSPCVSGVGYRFPHPAVPRHSVGGGKFIHKRGYPRFRLLKTTALGRRLTFGDPFGDSGVITNNGGGPPRGLAVQRLDAPRTLGWAYGGVLGGCVFL